MRLTHVEAAVLAGGEGPVAHLKALADSLGQCVERVRVVLGTGQEAPRVWNRFGIRARSAAPIVGVHTALGSCEASAVLVVAGDLESVDPRVVLALLSMVPSSGGPDVVAPVSDGKPEPLLAVYRASLLQRSTGA